MRQMDIVLLLNVKYFLVQLFNLFLFTFLHVTGVTNNHVDGDNKINNENGNSGKTGLKDVNGSDGDMNEG